MKKHQKIHIQGKAKGLLVYGGVDNYKRLTGPSSSPGRGKNFLFSTSGPVMGFTQLPIRGVPEALSPGVKRQGRGADHTPPAVA
jgi:hypothetical protein